jgi:Leucine-rich repeat (LRR) protein
LYENQLIAAILHLKEAEHLLNSQVFLIEQANKAIHVYFNSSSSKYAAEHNSLKLSENFRQLKEQYDEGSVNPQLVEKVNTLIALSQVQMLNDVNLSHITRLTDEFCITLQDCYPNYLERLRIESTNLCAISKELRQFCNLSDFSVFTGKTVRLPPEIRLCQNLKRISITFTAMDQLPSALGRLNNLVELDVSDNLLLRIPASLSACEKLRTINAARNPIDSLPSELEHCKNITVILDEDDEPELTRRFAKCCTIA